MARSLDAKEVGDVGGQDSFRAHDLLDGIGALIVAQDANAGPDGDEILHAELGPGTYFVSLSAAGPLDPAAGEYDLTVRLGDVSISMEPELLTSCSVGCAQPIGFTLGARNLRSTRSTTADYALLLTVGAGSPITLFEARARTLGAAPFGAARRPIRRTLRHWLNRAGVSECPSGESLVRFTFVAREAAIEVDRASFVVTLTN
ncbi:MAG: hypothetical protein HYR85_25195 [Planctomycetes bacterium]|nr:hypothetical protein [Planctomycetota bacterium]MBI3843314.1 hypothetical protein [Planctomycetota bacterium]